MPHLVRSAFLSILGLKIADYPEESGNRVGVPEVARVLVAFRFTAVPKATKLIDHALQSLHVSHP
jgi:hypothetical protein